MVAAFRAKRAHVCHVGSQDSVYGPDHDEVGKIAARAPKRKAAEPENAAAVAASRDWKVCHAHLALPVSPKPRSIPKPCMTLRTGCSITFLKASSFTASFAQPRLFILFSFHSDIQWQDLRAIHESAGDGNTLFSSQLVESAVYPGIVQKATGRLVWYICGCPPDGIGFFASLLITPIAANVEVAGTVAPLCLFLLSPGSGLLPCVRSTKSILSLLSSQLQLLKELLCMHTSAAGLVWNWQAGHSQGSRSEGVPGGKLITQERQQDSPNRKDREPSQQPEASMILRNWLRTGHVAPTGTFW